MAKEHNIVITDLARGDDEAAVLYAVASARRNFRLSFVSTFGNRSSAVCFRNLTDRIPEMNTHLRHPSNPPPQIFYGADRPLHSQKRYGIPPDGIERVIHGDMGNDTKDRPYTRRSRRTIGLYESLTKQTQGSIRVLSLGATTELPLTIKSLGSRIRSLVIMGGTITIQGNTNPHQEANFRHDPFSTKHALALAERQRIPVVLVPLDVSEQEGVLFTADRIRFLRDRVKSTYAMRVIEGVAGPESAYGSFYFNRTYHSPVFPYTVLHYKGVPLHDVTAAVIQDDFHDGATIFSYGPLDAQVNELGELGVARKYMQPHNAVIVTGPLKNYDDHWRRIVDRLQAYASCT